MLRPNEAICIGGSWRIPVINGLLSKNFVNDLKSDGTYSPLTFAREYESKWGGGSEDSFFQASEFDKCRVLQTPVWEAPYRPERGTKFIIGYDVGRTMDNSSAVVLQLTPVSVGGSTTYLKKLVNIYDMESMHFSLQSIFIKKLYYQYKADKIIIDANGLGVGLVDFLTIANVNEKTGETYPPFGVDRHSDPKKNYEKYYKTKNGVDNALYLVKAGGESNSEMHNLVSAQIASGKIQFLIDDQLALEKMKRTVAWKTYSEEKKIEMIKPYKLTKILREEMLNLKKKNMDGRTALTKISTGLKKDKFSAFEYAVYYARQLELKNKNKTFSGLAQNLNINSNNRRNSYSRDGSIRDRFSTGREVRGQFRR